ncbi:hypothetical protein EC973_005280 [Apophysomyces ossiformis]|uniref:UV-stimulated scaffold protein A C-terminal domain-containing protein n=1 Tax=Apophysomyces ossiformis TaxID=679940 RepID=A0A8H7BTL9_9FUNG|nr:hypothetical protein EC973_005280 [Apophysomyces ossiformis]
MDIQARDELNRLITTITETGEWILDTAKLKSIKRICKQSDTNVDIAFDLIVAQLKKQHSQIRYSSLQLIESLFQRSHRFRILLTEEFPLLLQLTVGIHQKKLPPPTQVADKLRQYAITLTKEWLTKFGDTYRPIGIGYDYLNQRGLLVHSTSLQAIHEHDNDQSGRQTRMKIIQEQRFSRIKTDMDEHLDLIQENLRNMRLEDLMDMSGQNTYFEMLVPKNIPNAGEDIDFEALISGKGDQGVVETDYKERIMSHGLASNRYNITIELSENSMMDEVEETEENKIIYEQLRETYKLLETKHVQQVNGWINTLIKLDRTDKSERESMVKQLIDVKGEMTETLRKANLLGITLPSEDKPRQTDDQINEDNDEYSDELFEDIEIPDLAEPAPESVQDDSKPSTTISSVHLPPSQRIFPLAYEPAMVEDVTYSGGLAIPSNLDSTKKLKAKGKEKEDPVREEHLRIAPVVEWGDDLYYWDKKNVQFNTSGIERSHRFMGVGEGTQEMPEHLLENLRKRTTFYRSEQPKELPACKAPLRSGGLCPRRDLVQCPFHGKIIPRDDFGQPLDLSFSQEDRIAGSSSTGSSNSAHALWQEIEKDVMAQAGQKHISKDAKQRKKRKATALIDVRKKKETSYTRLQKKLNDPKIKQLVEAAAEHEQSIKLRDQQVSRWQY